MFPDTVSGEIRVKLNAGDRANFEVLRDHLLDASDQPFLTPERAIRASLALSRRAVELGLVPQLQTPPPPRA